MIRVFSIEGAQIVVPMTDDGIVQGGEGEVPAGTYPSDGWYSDDGEKIEEPEGEEDK